MSKYNKRSFGLADILSTEDLSAVLRMILYFLFGFLVLGIFAYFIEPTPATLTITQNSSLLAGITLFSIFLLHTKRISLAVWVILTACGIVLFSAAWNGAGVMGPAFICCGVLVLGATIYWGQRAGLLAALILGVLGLILVAAGRVGWLVNSARPIADWFMWAVLVSIFLLIALMTGVMLKYLENLVSQAHQELAERVHAEDEVRRLNAELEQRMTERTAQLAESERLLKIISENVQDAIWISDLQLNTTYATPSMARMVGYGPEETLPATQKKGLTPESYTLAMQTLQEELENEAREGVIPNRSRIMHLDYYRKDGSTIRMEVRASFLRDEQGQPIGMTGVSRDISERNWMEKALLESEERYRKINSVISDYSYSAKIDRQGQFSPEWVAGAFADITGYAFDEYLASGGWENLLHPDSRTQDELDRDTLLANRPVEGSQLRITRKDGETRWVRNFAQPVWDKTENRLCGVYGGVQDITAEIQATERLRSLNADLEKRVADRTVQLENALSELESFSYSISHDLRAPLRAVNGYAGILLADYQSQFSPEVVEKMKSIQENGQRMGKMVDGLLEFLRSGSDQIIRQSVNPGEIVQSVLERLRSEYKDRPVEIIVGELPPCSANLRLLDKVFEGLISNAIKFTRKRPAARIEIGALEQGGQPVYLVRDNGVGFDMKYSDKLFGVFQRLHHTSEFEGIGASLAVIQRIIHRHDGRIWAEAEANKGATFYFTIG